MGNMDIYNEVFEELVQEMVDKGMSEVGAEAFVVASPHLVEQRFQSRMPGGEEDNWRIER